VPHDGRVGVPRQPACPVAKVVPIALASPVAVEAPATVLARVAEPRPAVQLAEHLVVHPVIRLLGDTRAVVLCPALNDGVEDRNQGRLGRTPVLTYDLPHLAQVSLTSLFARLDQRFETRPTPVGAGTILSHPVLPDVEAEKVKAYVPLVLVKRVGYAGFAGLYAQPHLGQPGFGLLYGLHQGFQVFTRSRNHWRSGSSQPDSVSIRLPKPSRSRAERYYTAKVKGVTLAVSLPPGTAFSPHPGCPP